MAVEVVLDLPVVERNIRRFHALVEEAEPVLRAHVKGHRTVEIGRRQVDAGAVGILAQTTPEAARYLEAGIGDIVFARPVMDAWRLPRMARFAARVARLTDGTGSVQAHVADAATVGVLAEAAVSEGVEIGLRIDVRFGPDRGVAEEGVADLARAIDRTPGVRLSGVTGYSGPKNGEEVRAWSRSGRRMAAVLVEIAEGIRADGMECPTVAVSGTVNAVAALNVSGVTEVCAGAYALYDAGLASVGVCEFSDVAIRIRAGVTENHGGQIGTEADEMLFHAYQEWDRETVATRTDGSPWKAEGVRAGDTVELLPAHVCPLMPRVERMSVPGARRRTWTPVCTPEPLTPEPEDHR